MLPQKPRLPLFTPRNNPVTATYKSTELLGQSVSNDIVTVHKRLAVSNTMVITHKSVKVNKLSIGNYEIHKVKYEQRKQVQKIDRNRDQKLNMATSTINPNFIPLR